MVSDCDVVSNRIDVALLVFTFKLSDLNDQGKVR